MESNIRAGWQVISITYSRIVFRFLQGDVYMENISTDDISGGMIIIHKKWKSGNAFLLVAAFYETYLYVPFGSCPKKH